MNRASILHVLRAYLPVLFACAWLTGCTPREEVYATWAVPPLPETPAGKQFEGYLEALNAGDEQGLTRFVQASFSPDGPNGADLGSRVQSVRRFYEASRGLNLYEVAESEDYAVTVVAQMRLTQEWRRMRFMVESAPPHRVTGIMIQPVEAPAQANAKPLTDAEVAREIGGYLQTLADADRFSGVVVVARDGKPFFERAYGMADAERGAANDMAKHFNVASVGKMFTAVAIAQLAEAGKLSYEAPIHTYLPEYPAEITQRVTVEQLLTHHSGIVDLFELAAREHAVSETLVQRDYIDRFMREPLRFEPGARFEYSNSNYVLLGEIIARLSGQSYPEYLQEHVFAPARMQETYLSSVGLDPAKRAYGYTQMGADGQLSSGERRRFGDESFSGGAAGGAVSTAADLLRFDRALRTHQLLGAEATEALLADRVNYARPGYRYGYGFITRRAGNERIVGHSGGFPGVDAQFDMYMKRGYTVIALANYEAVAEPVVMRLQELIVR